MKAHTGVVKSRFTAGERRQLSNELNMRVEKRLEAERDVFSMRVIGTVCVVDHELFGHGKKRLLRKIARLTDELNDRDNWGEVSDEVLAKNLRVLGLDSFADRLLETSKLIDEVVNEFWEG